MRTLIDHFIQFVNVPLGFFCISRGNVTLIVITFPKTKQKLWCVSIYAFVLCIICQYLQIFHTMLLAVFCQIYGATINEPESYSPTNKPLDISGTRSVLGYDKYEHQTVEHARTNTKYPFGNNWEQFDKPEDYQQYNNFPYSG